MISKENWLIFILIVVTTFTFVTLLGDMSVNVKGFEFRLSMEIFDSGLTEINIPPIGIISATTHQTPIKIGVTLINIDLDLLQELINAPFEQDLIIEQVMEQVKWYVFVFTARMLFIAALGGAFAILLLHKRDILAYFKGALAGFAIIFILVIGTYHTYDVNQFSNPQYRGVIKAAPWMIAFVEEALVKVDQLSEQLKVTADNLYELFEKVDIIGPVGEFAETIKILHVSDIHNNPAAYQFIYQVAESFEVDFIIDTGDISDFGSPLEARLLERIKGFPIPYVFVAGNHDSPGIIAAMGQIDNVIVINDEIVTVKGFNIIGQNDPASVSSLITPPDEETILRYTGLLEEILNASEVKPDILIVHHPLIAEAFAGKIPVILHGHRHKLTLNKVDNSVIIDAGTSGAAGIRGLQSRTEVPYSVVLLHFVVNENEKYLRAADKIRVYNLEGGFNIERIVFDH